MSRHLGLDLGGTNIKWAVLSQDEEVVADGSLATEAARGPAAVVERLAEAGRRGIAAAGAIDTIGVGVPGLYDAAAGTIRFFPNLPGPWEGHPVASPLSEALGAPVRLVNDCRAFALAEGRVGAARGCQVVVGVAIGTGVGGGVIVDGRVHQGLDGTAGEIGHQTVVVENPLRCGCGNLGCLETVASAAAIARACGQPTADRAFNAARAGDPAALAGLERVAAYLGIGIANAIVLLTPERVVVGGGVGEGSRDLLLEPVRRVVRERVRITDVSKVEIVPAALGSRAGAIGAALHGADR